MRFLIFICTFLFMLAGSANAEGRPQDWVKPVAPQDNFYQVSRDVFRSEQPSESLLPYIKRHNIQVIINLRSRDRDKEVFKNQPNIKLVHIPIHTWKLGRDDLLKVMLQIQKAKMQNKKVLIHCYHGSDRTGASIAMYRIIFEHWTIDKAVREMKQGGYGFHSIWRNIGWVFTPKNVQWIRERMPTSM